MPVGGEDPVHGPHQGAGLVEQDLVHQERHQERHRDADQGPQNGDQVGDEQLPAVAQHQGR